MSISFEDAQRARKKFEREYVFTLPWSDYINGMGAISRVGINDPYAPSAEHNDYCLRCYLERALPEGLSLPEAIDGVRVFIDVIGPIVAESEPYNGEWWS